MESQAKVPMWSRIALGLVTLAVLAFTLPALSDTTANPALATLPADQAAVAYGFLFRQLAIALVAAYAAYKATPTLVMMGAAGLFLWNAFEGIFLLATQGANAGSIAGIVFAVIAGAAFVGARKA